MIFKYVFILSVLFYGYSSSLVLFTDVENLMGSSIQGCLNCFCHARTGCWNRITCARYSITKDYWKQAGSPVMRRNEGEDQAYRTCMANENCVLNTLKLYTESFGQIDCNYDGVYDCKDRFAIHLFGDNCHRPNYGSTYASRFNECAASAGVGTMRIQSASNQENPNCTKTNHFMFNPVSANKLFLTLSSVITKHQERL